MNLFRIAFFSLFITSISVCAQGYNRYNGQRNNGFSDSDAQLRNNTEKPSAEEIEKNRATQIDRLMNKLKTELTLDELQFIAIKNEVTSNNKAIEIVIKKENSEEAKTEEIKAMMEKSEKTINSYLNAIQKEKYKLLKEEAQSPNKKKKSKKKGKADDEQ